MTPNYDTTPIVEDDQGEGWIEPLNPNENEQDREQRRLWRIEEKLRRKRNGF